MDIIGFISTQEPVASWTNAKKIAMLDDYVSYYGYQETIINEQGEEIANPQSKKEFANEKLMQEIIHKVSAVRRRVAENAVVVEELVLSL